MRQSVRSTALLIENILHCERCNIYVSDWIQGSLFEIASPPEAPLLELKISSCGSVGNVVLTGSSLQGYLDGKSFLLVPLRNSSEDIIGVVELLSKESGAAFTPVDEGMLRQFCSTLGEDYKGTSISHPIHAKCSSN
jgi:hypothetical protein